MERREFIRSSCTLCIAMGAGLISEGLMSCTSVAIYHATVKDHTVRIPKSIFDETTIRIVRPENLTYDIAVRRENDESYVALLLRCTHADNPVSYDGQRFHCPLHGSSYDEHGAVTHGPAVRPLLRLRVQMSDNDIVVFL